MSIEQVKEFIEKMKTDEAFRQKVMAVEDAAGRIACIQSEGFDCTAEEINEAVCEVNNYPVRGGIIQDHLHIQHFMPGH
ncbi:Nif11-like leader peptide family natural product precursor [Chlorobium limicola]